jgi:hypothetical protein
MAKKVTRVEAKPVETDHPQQPTEARHTDVVPTPAEPTEPKDPTRVEPSEPPQPPVEPKGDEWDRPDGFKQQEVTESESHVEALKRRMEEEWAQPPQGTNDPYIPCVDPPLPPHAHQAPEPQSYERPEPRKRSTKSPKRLIKREATQPPPAQAPKQEPKPKPPSKPMRDQRFVCTAVGRTLLGKVNAEFLGDQGYLYVRGDAGLIGSLQLKEQSSYRITIEQINSFYDGKEGTDAPAK